MQMAEKQQVHRQGLEVLMVKEQLTQSRRGQNFAIFYAVAAVAAATYLAEKGHETAAIVVIGTTLVNVVQLFLDRLRGGRTPPTPPSSSVPNVKTETPNK